VSATGLSRANRARHWKERDGVQDTRRNETAVGSSAIQLMVMIRPYFLFISSPRASLSARLLPTSEGLLCLLVHADILFITEQSLNRRWCAALDTYTAISTPRLLLYASGPTSDGPQVLHVCQTADTCGRALGRSPADRIERLGQDQSGPGSSCV
jgi:hypothetical protein